VIQLVKRNLQKFHSFTAFYQTIMRFGIDRLTLPDDFAVDWSPQAE